MTRLGPVIVIALFVLAGLASGQEAVAPGETLAEVRIHGNHTTIDDEVLRIAGLAIGQPVDAAVVDAAAKRLRASGRFEDVEIRKRYRSLVSGGEVALVIVVREHPLPDQAMPGPPALRPFRRLWASGMFMPIVGYHDGYGFTYGARVSFLDRIGRGSRVSFPLSWGGTRRAAVELEKTMSGGPFDRVFASVAAWKRTNPFYETDESRREVRVEVSRTLAGRLRAAGHAGYGTVRFGTVDEHALTYGAELSVDTRMDPVFPRNAVYASVGWERLDPTRSAAVNRVRAEARGYRGLIGRSVLSLRVQYAGADGAQPLYARNLLGGAGTLRGYRAGSFSGDNLLAASAEIRVPLTAPMGISRAGVSVFADTGTVWNHGETLSQSRFRAGGGAGVFLLASLFEMSLDVGFREGGGTRVHFTTGLQF